MSKLEEEEGQGAGCLCDPPALWERVQWKIVPTANPWQANYSFDPLGVCITVGGREATHSGAQCSYGLDWVWFRAVLISSRAAHVWPTTDSVISQLEY